MRDLIRAAAQFACETTIYACERILESIHAERPHHDEPLPDGHTDMWPDDDLWPRDNDIKEWLDRDRVFTRRLAEQTDIPPLYWPEQP